MGERERIIVGWALLLSAGFILAVSLGLGSLPAYFVGICMGGVVFARSQQRRRG